MLTNITSEELFGLVLILIILAIFFYLLGYLLGVSYGKYIANNEIKLEANLLINKIDNVLSKKQNTEINKKYNLRIQSNKLKKNIHYLSLNLTNSKNNIKNLEKEINIEKCKLMLINTEIENLKKKQ